MQRSENPCRNRLSSYEPGDLVYVEPAKAGLLDFYKQVMGIRVTDGALTKGTAAHLIGWGRCSLERRQRQPIRIDDPVDNYVVRVAVPYGETMVVSCCQIVKRLSPLEALALSADEPYVCDRSIRRWAANMYYQSSLYSAVGLLKAAWRRL